MAWTYTALKAAIYSYVQTDSSGFTGAGGTDETDAVIRLAEDRIYKAIYVPSLKKNVLGAFTASNRYLAMPSDFLAPFSLAVISALGVYTYLLDKDASFIREAYSDPAGTGVPRFYAWFDDENFLIGPTPSASLTAELEYFYQPASIVDTATSWLGDNAESALLAGCILEAGVYLKLEDDTMKTYAARYTEALSDLKRLNEGRERTDNFRTVLNRIPVR